jgi:DNA polymerase III delta prime subunit
MTNVEVFMKRIMSEDFPEIKHKDLLLVALDELNSLIGMKDLKIEIVRMIKTVILNKRSGVSESNMYHTVLTGSPGVGKTAVAKILCKIFSSLGVLKETSASTQTELTFKIPPVVAQVIQALKMQIELDQAIMDKMVEIIRKIEYHVHVQQHANEEHKRQIGVKQSRYQTEGAMSSGKRARMRQCKKLLKTHVEDIEDNDDSLAEIMEILQEGEQNTFLAELQKIASKRPSPPETTKSEELPFKLVSSHDLVGEYVGQTGPKVQALLESCRGKVVFIDEAYKLHDSREGSGDFLGLALTMIIEWMDKHRDETIFIFAGYADMLQKTIFRIQPGLKRRCQWIFNIKSYTSSELFEIFELLRGKSQLILDPKVKKEAYINILESNLEFLTSAGGDMEQLIFLCGLISKEVYFDSELREETIPSYTVTTSTFESAIKKIKTRDSHAGERRGLSKETLMSLYT